MSGPDYPPKPRSGSNGIGRFVIGVSSIGELPSFDFEQTIINQYANSPVLRQLVVDFNDCVDPTLSLESFFDLLYNVDTAQGYGLDVWGRIVGVTRTLSVPNDVKYFGFREAGLNSPEPWNSAPWYSGASLTNNFDLADDSFRRLIYAKALSNISDGSIGSINQILINLFPGRGKCYVVDNLDMSTVFVFEFYLAPVELAIVSSSGVLPKPTGVSLTISPFL